jgi:lipid-A-disaccharide synthase
MLVKIRHVGIVNIMAGKEVVPELIQSDFTAAGVALKTRSLLENRDLRDKMVRKLVALRDKLGTPGAADRVAKIALSMMSEKSGMALEEIS